MFPPMPKVLPLAATIALLALTSCGVPSQPPRSNRPPTGPVTRSPAPPPELRQCLADLSAAGAVYARHPDQDFGNGCRTVGTVKLASLRGDDRRFTITNIGPVTCDAAQKFSGWARFGVDRAAREYLGSGLARIETYGSYQCRNVAGTSRRSGHASANAIDVAAFVLENGKRVSVLDDWDGGTREEREFLRVVWRSACKRFGTVLGPEYNAAHKNHFHLEADRADFCR